MVMLSESGYPGFQDLQDGQQKSIKFFLKFCKFLILTAITNYELRITNYSVFYQQPKLNKVQQPLFPIPDEL